MNSVKTIKIIEDFNPTPYGRDDSDGEWNGMKFRDEVLYPALIKNDNVIVDLSGYVRYGPSFIDEVFGGLIFAREMSLSDLDKKLTIISDDLQSLVDLAHFRMEKANDATQQNT